MLKSDQLIYHNVYAKFHRDSPIVAGVSVSLPVGRCWFPGYYISAAMHNISFLYHLVVRDPNRKDVVV